MSIAGFAVMISGFFTSTQAQKRGGNAKPKTNAESASPIFEPSNPALVSAWQSGGLPAPLPVPAGNTDEAAAILAQKVAAKNEESVPALLTALRLSGFFITKKDGSVLLAPPDGKGQGLVINGWEVAAAAKMFGEDKTTSLDELNERLRSIPEFRQTDPAKLMMQGVRQNAENTENPFLRIWARFILELGKHSATANDEKNEKIDAIQHLFLFRRLYGDIFSLAEKYKSGAAVSENFKTGKMPRFYGASFYETAYFDGNFTDEKQIPCRMDGNAPTVMDAAATGITHGYGELIKYLQKFYENTPTGDRLKKAGMAQAVANIILVYAKFIQTYAALDVKLALDGEPPLVRTKNAAPGERKNLYAEVRMNIGDWQMYNCIRTALNVTAGIDFATVNDGPIGDVGVNWHLDEGGGKDVYSNSTGISGKEQIVGFTKENAPRIQNAGTGAGAGTKGTQIGNVRYGKTDNKGISRIIIEGSPQKNAKTYKAKPVMKQAVVRTTIKIKAGEIKGDMVDVLGQAIGGVGGLITMPAELLYRIDWASSGTLTIPVKDWEDCAGGWSGTITAVKKLHRNTPIAASGNLREAVKTEDRTLTAKLKLDGEQDRNGGFANAYFADITVNYEESNYARNFYEKFVASCLGRVIHSSQTQIFEKKTKAEGDGRITVFVSQGGNSGTLSFNTVRAVGETSYSQVYKTGCPVYDQTNTKSEKNKDPFIFDVEGFNLVIDVDPKNPDVLSGTKTVKDSDGSEIIYSWNLTYCR